MAMRCLGRYPIKGVANRKAVKGGREVPPLTALSSERRLVSAIVES